MSEPVFDCLKSGFLLCLRIIWVTYNIALAGVFCYRCSHKCVYYYDIVGSVGRGSMIGVNSI